jgi:hypothetical protein
MGTALGLSDGISLNSINDANSGYKGMEFNASKVYFRSGLVGIGTPDPQAQLHVMGPIYSSNMVVVGVNSPSVTSPGPGQVGLRMYNGAVVTEWEIGQPSYRSDLVFRTLAGGNYVDRMSISPSGDVNIPGNLTANNFNFTGTLKAKIPMRCFQLWWEGWHDPVEARCKNENGYLLASGNWCWGNVCKGYDASCGGASSTTYRMNINRVRFACENKPGKDRFKDGSMICCGPESASYPAKSDVADWYEEPNSMYEMNIN